MSRLLDSLRKVEKQRPSKASDPASANNQLANRAVMEPGYFWTSVLWLTLVCGLIVGAFMLLH